MRELTVGEIDSVSGGNPVLAVAAVVAFGTIALVAYAIHEGCNVSAEIGSDGVKIKAECKKA